jgi:AcrR family transcriptional regulator
MELNKHQQNSARTREKIIDTAEQLYGSRSIDAVSLSEITTASGQKNRNALQYHFKNRDGLLQEIVDRNSAQVNKLREAYLLRAEQGEWPAAEAAARCLAMPLVDYIEQHPQAVNFVRIVSQLAALNPVLQGPGIANESEFGVRFPRLPQLKSLLADAMQDLPSTEAQRRSYMAANITFSMLANIYRDRQGESSSTLLAAKGLMVEQVICLLESFFAAPSKR